MGNKKHFFSICLGLLGLSAGIFWVNKDYFLIESYFTQMNRTVPHSPQIKRDPASLRLGNQKSLLVLNDYFGYQTYGELLSFDIEVQLRTNHLNITDRRKAQAVIKNSLKETLESYSSPNLKKALTQNFFKGFFQNVLNEIQKKSIAPGIFQMDLSFVPKINQKTHSSFLQSLPFNWQEKGGLYQELTSGQSSLAEQIKKLKIPHTNQFYQYRGGQISFWLNTSPADIPKGMIRFRRYFKSQGLSHISPYLNKKQIKLNNIEYKLDSIQDGLFTTVDLFQEFEPKSLELDRHSLEIHFGSLLSNQLNGWSRNRSVANSEQSGRLLITGEVHVANRMVPFQSRLTKLTYDFKKGNFGTKSRLNTSLGFETPISSNKSGRAKLLVKDLLLGRYATEMVKHFELHRFHEELGGRL